MSDRGRYHLEVSVQAAEELARLRPFDQRPIVQALRQLVHQAEIATKNRKPLREPIHELPAAGWEIRVGSHRVFYEIREGRTVRVLRVIIKTGTTSESL